MKTRFLTCHCGLLLLLNLTLHGQSVIQFPRGTFLTVTEANNQFLIAVQRLNDLETVVSVDYASTNLTATPGADYLDVSGTLTFAAGETNRTITVGIINDGLIESAEKFKLTLSNPSAGAVLGPKAALTVQITDNDKGVQLESAAIQVIQVAEDQGSVTITVIRGDDGDFPLTVDYATADRTATAGTDYTAMAGTLTFAAGETTKTITVPILNDGAAHEFTESFQLALANPSSGGVLGTPSTATVMIVDDDPGLSFERSSYSVSEGNPTLTVVVLRGSDLELSPFTVDYITADGTAQAGQDYVAASGTLAFAAGEMVKQVSVSILKDGLKEDNETFKLTLTNRSGVGVIGSPTSATVKIMDNDPGVGFERDQYVLCEYGPSLQVRVLRGNDGELGPFTVELATEREIVGQTAVEGLDYLGVHTTLAFAQGETAKTVEIVALADGLAESDEPLQLVLRNLQGAATLRASNATVWLLDGTGFAPHGFDDLTVLPGGTVELSLAGHVSQAVQDDFDLYPIEVSTNLVDWAPWVTLQRTNADTNVLRYQDLDTAGAPARFYRTTTNHCLTPYPKPPGPFPVGVVSRLVTDPARRDRYPELPGPASFMISVWYPAVAEAGKPFARLEDEELTYAYGKASRRNLFRSSGQPDVPCNGDGAPYPILAYSPGGWGFRTELAERGPYLASYGYVVIAADPIDVPTTVLPDGTVLAGRSSAVTTAGGFQDRVRDIRVVLDTLARWNIDDPLFKGRLDVTNAAVAGWSWGGGVAAEACRVDARCRAALSFEGYYQNAETVLSTGLVKPILGLYAGNLYEAGPAMALHNKATHDSIWFQIRSTAHESFGDYYWNDVPKGGREAADIMNTYTLWFLNKYLKGRDDPLPDPKDYPRIFNFNQK